MFGNFLQKYDIVSTFQLADVQYIAVAGTAAVTAIISCNGIRFTATRCFLPLPVLKVIEEEEEAVDGNRTPGRGYNEECCHADSHESPFEQAVKKQEPRTYLCQPRLMVESGAARASEIATDYRLQHQNYTQVVMRNHWTVTERINCPTLWSNFSEARDDQTKFKASLRFPTNA
ncbi:hypothetical protein EGR_09589 [Echinococcus granulosus]|uniref:Uncharacterized protein n=2 Tax=Echinococcus granulosus TaxID=6210 RepID=W6UAQ4_ECHGR|nr:hypothetical protein EGR_09589 [Echinococcus granulosus]EUB55552.1 hypothetical protein EGR_09589 [Echinococcus granulosus]